VQNHVELLLPDLNIEEVYQDDHPLL